MEEQEAAPTAATATTAKQEDPSACTAHASVKAGVDEDFATPVEQKDSATDVNEKEGESSIPMEEKKEAEDVVVEEVPAAAAAEAAAEAASTPDNDDAEVNPSGNVPAPATTTPGEPTGKGAQILMNRFQSLKERANQNAQTLWSKSSPALSNNAKAVQERAEQFWKTTATKLPVARVPFRSNVPKSDASASHSQTEETSIQDDGNDKTNCKDNTNSDAKERTESSSEEERVKNAGNEMQPKQLYLDKEEKTIDSEDHTSEKEEDASRDAAEARLFSGRALAKASLAASVAYESVATFRGRYNATTGTAVGEKSEEKQTDDDTVTDTRGLPESQTELILKSRVGQHMQEILDRLEPHEYAMLLGRGMLGVNLKQCYLRTHGVYVDFLVTDGQADLSGVVRSGDLPVRLGDTDLRKGTILDIPMRISQARRPVVLTFATGTKVALERINYIDVAVAMMHRAREYYAKRGSLSNLPSAASPPRKSHTDAKEDCDEIKSLSKVTVPAPDILDCFMTPPAPPLDVRNEFQNEVALRNLEHFVVEGLCQVCDMDSNFRETLRNAFLTCALDGRRLPFLSKHFSSSEEEAVQTDPKMTPSAQLMLFLELSSFLDLYHITPGKKIREIANKIAFKFFLPNAVNGKLQPPLFDFHHIVADSSLRQLETALKAKDQSIPRDIFFDFSKAVVESLSGVPFISFLTSSECSRMRAYLRNTAPYTNLPLREVIDGIMDEGADSDAKNCFTYILFFLICQVEKEQMGEYYFGSEDDAKKRLLGASNDLCCAIYIRRTFIPALKDLTERIENLKDGEEIHDQAVKKVVEASEKLWVLFIVGTMELSPRRDEIDVPFKSLRDELVRVAETVSPKDGGEVRLDRNTAEIFAHSKLLTYLTALGEEMIFNFATNTNSKFREHKFHEWLCSEFSKTLAKNQSWDSKQEIPRLPQGCIKRLLRKVDLPDGVSPHKPHKELTDDGVVQREYPNADFAVVFGSAVGAELVGEMPTPGIESSDIRRYTCLPLSWDEEGEMDMASAETILPPTFEGYAVSSPRKASPFPRRSRASYISEDGWEVSLTTFSIPNAESSGANSALYGVSLFLQCKARQVPIVQNRYDGFVHDPSLSFSNEFTSPLKTSTKESSASEGDVGVISKAGLEKCILVTAPLPAFDAKYKSTSWVSRVLGEEFRDPLQPLSIGVSLVSQKNVIISMRDTLSRLLFDYCGSKGGNSSTLSNCGALVDVLGNFVNKDIEAVSLRCILEPYIRAASAPWLERPLLSQAHEFENISICHMTSCLPPTPLALMFITVLMEQKIVLSSSRKSILLSATAALSSLLQPLKWSHLMVPMVPSSLVGDLIQYPAPFILGVPSEEADNADVMGNLPHDVTLIDLDIGRVILAPNFGFDNETVSKSSDPSVTANALRAQVLLLARALGSVFGTCLKPETWSCDMAGVTQPVDSMKAIQDLKQAARGFVTELLEGVSACCYWIEEADPASSISSEPTVLFDEDKFFEMKNKRADKTHKTLFPSNRNQGELALSLDSFDLVLESFLRCQSMSTYISSRPKTEMVYY